MLFSVGIGVIGIAVICVGMFCVISIAVLGVSGVLNADRFFAIAIGVHKLGVRLRGLL